MSSPIDALRAAFERQRPYHPTWPATFEAAMQDPVISRLIDIYARHVPAYSRKSADRLRIGWNGPVRVESKQIKPPIFDQKRLASGEKPEPDE